LDVAISPSKISLSEPYSSKRKKETRKKGKLPSVAMPCIALEAIIIGDAMRSPKKVVDVSTTDTFKHRIIFTWRTKIYERNEEVRLEELVAEGESNRATTRNSRTNIANTYIQEANRAKGEITGNEARTGKGYV
jgi:hypothetical protein